MRDTDAQVARSDADERADAFPHDHAVEFYESEEHLCVTAADFLSEGLSAGERLVIIARPAHRQRIADDLKRLGHDVDAPPFAQRIAWLDAGQCLAQILDGGSPRFENLQRCFGDAVASLAAADGGVRAYGEMVDLLWRDGRPGAALELEEHWNALARELPFSLLCGYAMGHFYGELGELNQEGFRRVCSAHSHVVSTALPNARNAVRTGADAPAEARPHAREGELTALQKRAHELETEIEQRRLLERALRDALDERRRAEDALREREQQLRAITDALPSPITLSGPDHRLRFGSRACERWFGLAPAALPGTHLRTLLGAEGFERIRPQLDASLEGRNGVVTVTLALSMGERAVEARFVPLRDGSDAVAGVVMHLVDVTEARDTERQVQRAHDQLEVVLRGVDEGIVAVDQSGLVVYANDTAATFSGAPTASALEGRSFEEIVSRFELQDQRGERVTVDQLPLRAALAGAHPRERLVHVRIPGSPIERWMTINVSPVRGADGEVQLAIVVARDSSDRIQQQVRQDILAEATRILAQTLDTRDVLQQFASVLVKELADWCLILLEGGGEPERILVHADPAETARATALIRAYPKSLDSEHGIRAVIRSGQAQHIEEIDDGMLERVATCPEHLALLRSEELRSFVCVPLRGRSGVLGALALFSSRRTRRLGQADLALAQELGDRLGLALENAQLYRDAREAERERAQLLESERAANRAKDEFLAMLGHELRNPLSPIVTALELMRMRLGDVAAREREVIERQVNHLSRLVDDLLDISRITRGKVELAQAPVDLAQVALKAIEMVSPLLEEKHHRLTTRIERPLWLIGDEHRLAQVIANLLTNAARYTHPGGAIELTAAIELDQVVVRVRDNGIGIPPELLPRLFELFVQGERTADRAQGGLGLGLSIVRSMVSLHGGSVEARSEGQNRGSEFVVRLPLPQSDVTPVPVTTSTGLLGVEPATTRRRILIVDDNVDAAEVLADVLSALGHSTRVVFDAPSALACVDEFRPDVALMDIGLPLMDGYELARRLRARPELSGMRMVAITGYGQSSDHQRSRDAGMDAHLVKPVDLDQIRALIDQLFPPGA